MIRTVSCVVPAHNESALIAGTVQRIVEGWERVAGHRLIEVIVVDDGSRDGTAAIVRGLRLPGVRVLRQEQQGKGAAVRNGVLDSAGDIVYFVDADLPFGPEDHVALTTRVSLASPVVCGYRGRHAHNSAGRHVASLMFAVVARGVTGLRLRNSQCGLKAFDGQLARHYFGQLTEPGFAMDVELLARMTRDRVTIVQHPVVLLPEQRTSSISAVRSGIAMTRALFRIRAALAAPAPAPLVEVFAAAGER